MSFKKIAAAVFSALIILGGVGVYLMQQRLKAVGLDPAYTLQKALAKQKLDQEFIQNERKLGKSSDEILKDLQKRSVEGLNQKEPWIEMVCSMSKDALKDPPPAISDKAIEDLKTFSNYASKLSKLSQSASWSSSSEEWSKINKDPESFIKEIRGYWLQVKSGTCQYGKGA